MNTSVIDISNKLNEALATQDVAEQPTVELLEPGIYPDITMEHYLALPYCGASRLEKLRRSALQYKHSLSEPPKVTAALDRGTALHLAILEPALFEGHYVVLGTCEGVKKSDKERCTYQASVRRGNQDWCKTHAPNVPDDNVEILTQKDYDAVLGMRDSITAHPRARSLFEGQGAFELTIIFDDPDTGIRCKIRPDRLIKRAGMLVDLKSTMDAATWAFGRQAENLGYFRKLAFYRRGLRVHNWPYSTAAVLAIESAPPFDLVPYLTDESDLDSADREITQLLRLLHECQQTNVWPGYTTEFALLSRPGWAKDGFQ